MLKLHLLFPCFSTHHIITHISVISACRLTVCGYVKFAERERSKIGRAIASHAY